MKHSFIDVHSRLNSPIHRLDPRTKLLSALAFVLAVVLTPQGHWQAYAAYFALIMVATVMSHVPLGFVLKRSLAVEATVLIIVALTPFFKPGEAAFSHQVWFWQVSVSHAGLAIFWNTLAKAWLSILCLTLLTSTTQFTYLLLAMEKLKLPRSLVQTLSFMYRYIFILEEEAMRMVQARDGRNFGANRLWQIRVVGHMAGSLFVRSYERGERVYAAMLARGFDGEVRTLHRLNLRTSDALFSALCLSALAAVTLLTNYR